MARQDWEFAVEEADDADALGREQRRRYLVDWDESDHGSGRLVRDLIWECTEERIEAWRNDEQLVDITGAPPAPSVRSEVKQEGKSLAEFSELELQRSLATGKPRRLIDEWQAEQTRRRKSAEEEMARRKAAEDVDPPLWEICTGI